MTVSHDVSDLLGDGSVILKGIRGTAHPDGKAYRFPSPSFAVGLRLTQIFNVIAKAASGAELDDDEMNFSLDDGEEQDLYRQVMGDTLEELKADGVPWASVQTLFAILLRKHAAGLSIEDQISSSGEGQAQPNRAARRATPKKTAGGKSRRASTVSANPTPAPASPASSTSPTEPEAAQAV